MPRLAILAVIALFLSGPPVAPAQETGPASRSGDVARLIEQLDSDDFTTREAATLEITRVGEAARPALVAAREAGSLERRVRIDQILRGLSTSTTSRPGRRDATLVTVDVAEKPLSEACAILSKQSGYAIRVPPGVDPVVTLSAKGVPFLQALDSLAAQTSRRTDWDGREHAIILTPTPEKPAPSIYAGPMRVTLVMLSISRLVRFGYPPEPATANLTIRIDAEEKLRALGVFVPLKLKEGVDDKNRDLRWNDPRAQITPYLQRMDQRGQTQAYVRLAAPEPDAKAIRRLEATLPLVVTAEAYEGRIASPEEGLEVSDGPFRAKIESWKTGPGQSEVVISITRPVLPPPGGTGAPVQDDVVTFLGPDGRTIVPVASASSAPAGSAMMMNFTLPAGSRVSSIEVSSLKRVELFEVPVVFENVPIP